LHGRQEIGRARIDIAAAVAASSRPRIARSVGCCRAG